MVTQLTDHRRQLALKHEQHEFHFTVNEVAIILRCFVLLFMIYVGRNEYYKKEKIKKQTEEKAKLEKNEKEVEELERRIEELGTIEDPREKFEELERTIDQILGRMEDSKETFGLQETFGVLPRRIDDNQEKFEDPQEKFDQILGRIDVLPRRIGAFPGSIDELQGKIGVLLGRIDELRGIMEDSQDKFGVLLGKMENPQERFGPQETFGALPGSIGELQGKMDQILRRMEHPQEILGLKETFVELQGKIDELQGKIEDPQEKFEALLGKMDQILRRMENPQEIFGLKETFGVLPGSTVELQEKIEGPRAQNDKYEQEKELRKEIDRRKAQYKSAWKIAQLYADWRKEEFQAENVTLDAATAHPALLLSEQGRQVTFQEKCQDLPSSTQRFDSLPCVLGQLGITTGRRFWEVKVEDARSWDLGICRDNVTRKGRVTMSPENGFWAIRLYEGDYWALTSPETSLPVRQKPHSVGIFLDYEDGEISFYNMTDGSHIFTFPKNTFYGVLRPLFRLWNCDSGTLTIV